MDVVERLSTIQQEIEAIESEKLHQEQNLGLIWEHPPPIDPEVVGRVMQGIRERIRELDERKRELLKDKEETLVQGALNNRRGNGNNGGN